MDSNNPAVQAFMGGKWRVTVKDDLVPAGTVYYFAAPKFVGNNYILEHPVYLNTLLKKYAYKTGDFTLTSGQKATEYLDVKNLLHLPLERRGVLLALLPHLPEPPGFAVAGVAVGGVPLATILADKLTSEWGTQCPQLTVRLTGKEHGRCGQIDGIDNIVGHHRVVLVEDVITTGQSTIAAMHALTAAGLIVVDVITVVDREQGGLELVCATPPCPNVTALTTLSAVRAAKESR